MKQHLTIVLLCLKTIGFSLALNDRPIIGILAQETYKSVHGTSYIAASYVKFVEAAGARVIPVLINQPTEYYYSVFNTTNGILFPGGSANVEKSGYGQAGKILFQLAKKANDQGDFYPIWGTCLGFELLSYLAAGEKNWMKSCVAQDMALPLKLSDPGISESRMFEKLPVAVKSDLQNLPVTINYHQWCFTPKNFTISGLSEFFRVLSVNDDSNNVTFVSTVEAFKYPFYGVAWHPEKNMFEFVFRNGHENIPHTQEAIETSQYFANFFVSEARKSSHKYKKNRQDLIYNYNPVYTGAKGSTFEQSYFFK